jgi:hypothetical protein
VRVLRAIILRSGTSTYYEEVGQTTRITGATLHRAAAGARQFKTQREAASAVRRFLRLGVVNRNVTSVIAEIIARRAFPGARTLRREGPDRADFVVRNRRFEVKSIVRGKGPFILGTESSLSRAHGRCPPDMFVFVRLWSFACSQDGLVDARADKALLSRRRLQLLFAQLERERGSLRKLEHRVKLTAAQLGFARLPRNLGSVWRSAGRDSH